MTKKSSWQEAQNVCNDNGGHLPTISSEEENTYVYNMFQSHCKTTYVRYLGFHDSVNETYFKWVDDSTSSYTKWSKDEPNDKRSNEDCAHFSRGIPDWNDINCITPFSNCFVCEDSKFYVSTFLQPLLVYYNFHLV